MRQILVDSSNNMENAKTRMLGNMFSGIENFKKEFPAIYEDIVLEETQNNVMRTSSVGISESNDVWQDFEKLRMIYDSKERKLKIKGRVHKNEKTLYAMAKLSIQNKQREICSYRYTTQQSAFFLIDEELPMEPADLDGIRAKITYNFRFYNMCTSAISEIVASQVEMVGIDIVGQGKILHPVSKTGQSKINIVYGRDGQRQTADYYYGTCRFYYSDNICYILLPIAVQFELDKGFALADDPNISGDIYVYSDDHGVTHFNNWNEVRMIPASWWTNGNFPFQERYPFINERFDSGYILALPQEWHSRMEKEGKNNDDYFYLSLDIQFDCRDGKRYSLEIDSQLNPKPYSNGAKIEIPCFYILWGCIEKNAQVEVMERGRIPVSEVQVGEKVLTKDNTYETVCDILTGDEEILKYVKVNGRELMVTMDHPIMAKAGWMPARELREGDLVLFEDGNFYPIQEIYDEPYYDKVYSLKLEHGEGFFANQIYVGDFNMQNNFKEEDIEISQEILDELEKFKNFSH